MTSAAVGQLASNSFQYSHRKWSALAAASLTLAAVSTAVFSIYAETLAVFIVFMLFGGFGYAIARKWGRVASELFVGIFSYTVLLTIVLFFIYLQRYGQPYYIGGSDDLAYEIWGRQAAQRLSILEYGRLTSVVIREWHNSPGYVYLVSLLIRLGDATGGFHTMIPRIFNAACLGLMGSMGYLLALRFRLGPNTATYVALCIGMLPIMSWTAAHTFRDIFTSLLTMTAVLMWSSSGKKVSAIGYFGRLLITLLLSTVIFQFRSFQVIAVLAVAVIANLLRTNVNPYPEAARVLLVVICPVAVLFYQDNLIEATSRLIAEQQQYIEYRVGLSDGLARFVFGTPAPWTYLLRTGYALIYPVPQLSTHIEILWLSIGTILRFLFLPFLFLGILLIAKDPTKWPIAVAYAVLFSGMVIVSFEQRHMAQFSPYELLLAGIGFVHYAQYRRILWSLMALVGMVGTLSYVILRLM